MAEKKLDPPKNPPSDRFCSAFRHSAGLVVTCDFCGRTYFGTGGDYNEGERENYEKLAEEKPDEYISVEDFSGRVELGQGDYVDGCPCNAARRFEDWVWTFRREIAEYVQGRAEEEFKDAKQELANLKSARLFANLPGTDVLNDALAQLQKADKKVGQGV